MGIKELALEAYAEQKAEEAKALREKIEGEMLRLISRLRHLGVEPDQYSTEVRNDQVVAPITDSLYLCLNRKNELQVRSDTTYVFDEITTLADIGRAIEHEAEAEQKRLSALQALQEPGFKWVSIEDLNAIRAPLRIIHSVVVEEVFKMTLVEVLATEES